MKKFTRFLLCFCAPLILSLFLVGCKDEGAEKYTVVYTVDGDQYCDMTYDVGTAPTLPEAPKKSGYSFSGWTSNGSLWNEAAHTSEDITVSAEFTPITYTVTYYNNLDDTSNPNPTSYTVISEDFNIEPLSFGGYRFIGWYADAALETPADTLIEKGSYGDLTFYGKWELIEHTATFKADGVTVGEVKFSEFSSSIDMPAIPEKLGYNAEWENFTLGAEDITVNAVYTPITYTITYYKNLDNASNPNPASYTVISEDFNIEPLSFEGYNFLGWYSDSALETPADTLIEKGSSGNLVFYGKWELEEHSAIFKADGIPVGEVKFNEFTSLIDEPAVPEKNGYTGAWESYSLGAEDITVNAVYTPIIYTITYYERLDGVTNVNKTEYTVESEDFTISPLTHQHYLFDGWFTDEICTALADTSIEKGTTGNVVLYAKWTAKEYTVTFKADGETVTNVGFTVETESIQKPEVPKKAGYNAKWEAFMLGTESFTVNAVYTPITYRITYETNLSGVSGGTLATFTVESETFSLPIPEEENCVFIGWYTDKALTVAANEQIEKGSVGDVKLYAKLECTHSYDYTVTKKAAALKDGVGTYSCKTCGRSYTEVIPATKSIKILAIGNSYSVDATRYLYGILEQAGIEEIRIVNMYIGGCPIDTHWENIQGDLSAYNLYESSKTAKTMVSDKTGSKSIRYAMELDDWDIVTLQQRSNYAGLPSTYTNLQNVIDYVKENEPGADIYWHMTWAYSPSRCESYPEFDRTQMGMYNAIIDTVNSVILNNPDIVGIIPTGTAIQNLRTSFLGDDLTRDNTHLSNGTGRYTAAMIWAKALTGCDLTDITGTPSYSSDNESYGDEIRANLVYIKEAVNNAYENPFAVTDSVYTKAPEDVGGGNENEGGEVGGGDTGGDTEGGESDGGETADPPTEVDFDATLSELTEDDIAYLTENGYSPDDYKVLDITFYDNEYYNSTGDSKRRVGVEGSFLNTFVATNIFSRYEIVVGSLIRLDVGRYRPEAWTALDVRTPSASRPDNCTDALTVVTDEWWGDFNYRAFNLRKSGSITSEQITSGFRIYIPVVKTAELTEEDVAFLEANGLNASEYKVLDFDYFYNQFYNSISSSSLSTPKESSAQYGRFIGLELMTRYDLTLGSIIVTDSGYGYRPEGWYDLDDKTTSTTRPSSVNERYTEVTEEWWSTYAYRGINLSKTVTGAITEDEISALRIYVKI